MLTLVATAAYAQETKLTANVPFAFRAAGSELPSGNYKLGAMASGSIIMELSNVDTGKTVFIPFREGTGTESTNIRPRLIFKCVAQEGCSLATVWSETGTSREFATPPPSAKQREHLETIYFDRDQPK